MKNEEAKDIFSLDDRHLWNQPAGLIIKSERGTLWSNQAGGLACTHPVERGFYVPLPEGTLFDGGYCWCDDTLSGLTYLGDGRSMMTEPEMDRIDVDLSKIGMKIDREKNGYSCEAWIHVILGCGLKAVLTCGNCD